jgi:hypothetical protein
MGQINIIRYQTRADAADENQKVVEQVFAELAEKQPEDVRYTVLRLDDGVTFVHIVEQDGDGNSLAPLAAFQEFQRTIGSRAEVKPSREQFTVVGSYRFRD